MKMYNKLGNDAGDTYLYNAIAGIAGREHEEPGYNMQMIYHIRGEKNVDRDDLCKRG